MKSSIVIGPIQRVKKSDARHQVLRDRLNKMRVGNYFEISKISSNKEAANLRASLCYIAKKENVRISTVLNGSVLRVEKVRSARIETKKTEGVK